jgi:hypothetical protein
VPQNVEVANFGCAAGVGPGPVIAHSAPFAAIDRSLSARAAIHVDAPNMLQEQYLATNATLPAYCPSNALLKLQTDAGVAKV